MNNSKKEVRNCHHDRRSYARTSQMGATKCFEIGRPLQKCVKNGETKDTDNLWRVLQQLYVEEIVPDIGSLGAPMRSQSSDMG